MLIWKSCAGSTNRNHERREETASPAKALRRVRAAIHLAQEVGECLGGREILQRSLPPEALAIIPNDAICAALLSQELALPFARRKLPEAPSGRRQHPSLPNNKKPV
jgi:hypothetical protein